MNGEVESRDVFDAESEKLGQTFANAENSKRCENGPFDWGLSRHCEGPQIVLMIKTFGVRSQLYMGASNRLGQSANVVTPQLT